MPRLSAVRFALTAVLRTNSILPRPVSSLGSHGCRQVRRVRASRWSRQETRRFGREDGGGWARERSGKLRGCSSDGRPLGTLKVRPSSRQCRWQQQNTRNVTNTNSDPDRVNSGVSGSRMPLLEAVLDKMYPVVLQRPHSNEERKHSAVLSPGLAVFF